MLLTHFFTRMRDERGAALAAAMMLMLLGALLSVLILSSVVATFSATTATRATVQSEASAQGGLDVALASIESGNCVSTYSSNTAPKYSVAVSYTTSPTLTTPGLTWVSGCPIASAPFLKLTATGTAGSPAVGSTTFGNTEAVEAIYARPVSTATLLASGPAVYAYSSQSFAGSGTLVSLDGTNDADVMIRTGDVACSGGAAAKGDFVVNQGNLTLSGSCGVTGNVWASGSGKGIVNLSGGVAVGGNIVGNGLVISSGTVGGSTWTTGATTINSATIGGGVTVTANNFVTNGSNKIAGNLWASGSAELTNGDDVKGNATAQTLKLSGGNVGTTGANEAWSRGDVTGVTWFTIKSHLTAKSVPAGMTAGGGITIVPAGPGAGGAAPATPTAPVVPNWVNFAYSAADWPGYTVVTMGPTCSSATLQTAITSLGGGKGVIDARSCTAPIFMGGSTKVSLYADTAIISTYGFDLSYSKGGGGFTSTTAVDLFLITPDTTVETPPTPTCPTGSSISIGGGFTFTSNISAIVYTPCKVIIGSGINFYGQVFAGQTQVDGAAKLFYTTVGLPGWDLDTGTASTVTSSPNDWANVATRNVAG